MINLKARRAKTDGLDAEKLLRTLIAYWRGLNMSINRTFGARRIAHDPDFSVMAAGRPDGPIAKGEMESSLFQRGTASG